MFKTTILMGMMTALLMVIGDYIGGSGHPVQCTDVLVQ